MGGDPGPLYMKPDRGLRGAGLSRRRNTRPRALGAGRRPNSLRTRDNHHHVNMSAVLA